MRCSTGAADQTTGQGLGLCIRIGINVLPLIWVSLFTISGRAQSPITFERYTISDGLSHNTVRDILQDSTGFVWLATDDGLNKFDGYTFRKYLHTPNHDSIITNHPVRALAEDDRQNIWIGTWGGGVFVYNQSQDRFQSIAAFVDSSNLDINFVSDLYYDTQDRMWAGTVGGLVLIDTRTYSITSYQHDPANPRSLSSNVVLDIAEDAAGNLWLCTSGGGLNYFEPDKEAFTHFRHQPDDPSSLSEDDVYSVLYDSQQRLWVGTWNGGLHLTSDPKQGFVHFQHQPDNPGSLSNNQIWTIVENQGNVWVGTDNGLCLFNEADSSFSVHQNVPFDDKSLSANSIKCLQTDTHSNLWIGTHEGGANLYAPLLNQVQHYHQGQDAQSLTHSNVSAILELDSARLLVGTDGGGLNVLDRVSRQVTHYKHSYDTPGSIGGDKIKSLAQDQAGNVWISFWNRGMDRFNLTTGTFTHFREDTPFTYPWLESDNVMTLAQDQDGLIWVGTFGSGLYSFDPEQNLFTPHMPDASVPHNMSFENIWAVLVDHNNDVWVGTSRGRVDRLDRQQNRFVPVLPRPTDRQGYTPLVLFEDQQGQVWAGLDGGGLRLLSEDKGYPRYTIADGLPGNTVKSIEETPSGQFWISTNHGLARFDPVTGRSKSCAVTNELQQFNFNHQASTALSSGELAFGSTHGLHLFHPDSIQNLILPTPMVLTDFEVFNRPVAMGSDDSPLTKHINYTKSVTLSYEHSVFSISYAGINFTSPDLIRYQYRLLGFVDDSWQEAGAERKVTYTNLEPGRYTFEVTGILDDSPLPTRSLTITVVPPWWKTWWFRGAAGLLAMMILYAVFRIRSEGIRRTNRRLEEVVVERTRKLQQVNDQLREKNHLIQEQNEKIQTQAEKLTASNVAIQSMNHRLEDTVALRTADLKKSNEELDNFVYRVSHDIRAPLSSVLGLLELMSMEQPLGQPNNYPAMATKSIHKLDGFVSNILDYSRNSRLQLACERIDFHRLLDDVQEDLQYVKNAQCLEVTRDIGGQADCYGDPMRLKVIFRNLLSNAIKYQNPYLDHSFVHLQIRVEPTEVTAIVADNGTGIPEERQARVFDMFYRADDREAGSGIGLYIVKETVDKLGGSITLTSEVEKGTTFTIQLPNCVPE